VCAPTINSLRRVLIALMVCFSGTYEVLALNADSTKVTNDETFTERAQEFVESDAGELLVPALLPADSESFNNDGAIISNSDVDGLTIDSSVDFSNELNMASGTTFKLQWVMLALVCLGLIGILLKPRFATSAKGRSVSRVNDNVAFEAHAQELPEISAVLDARGLLSGDVVTQGHAHQSLVENGVTTGSGDSFDVTYLDDIEQNLDDSMELVSVDEVDGKRNDNMTFDERFTRLIEEQDYVFARELLDFARYNEVEDEQYHCERLTLFSAMQDQDGFHDYYNEIAEKIPGFPVALQTKIAQLVVLMAQGQATESSNKA